MFYLSKIIQSTAVQSPAFALRGIANYTVAKLSEVAVYAKPLFTNSVFDGYKANLEAFLFATDSQSRTSVLFSGFYLDYTRDLDLKLDMPLLCYNLKAKMSEEQIKKMQEKWMGSNVERIELGKKSDAQVFTMTNPSFSYIPTLKKMSPLTMNTPSSFTSLGGFICADFLYRCIDLFLATHTYPSYSSDDTPTEAERLHTYKRPGSPAPGKKSAKKSKKTKKSGDDEEMESEEQDDEMDLDDDTHIRVFSEVLVAKPSPAKSTVNFGLPSAVPNLPGVLFPYFPGMIYPDTGFIKDMVMQHFFKLLCGLNGTDDQKAGWLFFREHIGSFAHSEKGMWISHILYGIHLALDSQLQLFLLIDGGIYAGFCLLGAKAEINVGNKWHGVLSPEELRLELQTVMTSQTSIRELEKRLSAMTIKGGSEKTGVLITSSYELAEALAVRDFSTDSPAVQDICRLLKGVNFAEERFCAPTVDSIIRDLPFLVAGTNRPGPYPVFIPIDNLPSLSVPGTLTLLAYGSRVPSFRTNAGLAIQINSYKEGVTEKRLQPAGEKAPEIPCLICTMKPLTQALTDWKMIRGERKIWQKFNERAKDQRCHVWRDASCKKVFVALSKTLGETKLDKGKGKGKEKQGAMDDEPDFDDLFA